MALPLFVPTHGLPAFAPDPRYTSPPSPAAIGSVLNDIAAPPPPEPPSWQERQDAQNARALQEMGQQRVMQSLGNTPGGRVRVSDLPPSAGLQKPPAWLHIPPGSPAEGRWYQFAQQHPTQAQILGATGAIAEDPAGTLNAALQNVDPTGAYRQAAREMSQGAQGALDRASAPMAPLHSIANRLAHNLAGASERVAAGENPGAVMSDTLATTLKQLPAESWQGFVQTARDGRYDPLEFAKILQHEGSPESRARWASLMRHIPGGAATVDFGLTLGADALSGHIWGRLVGELSSLLGSAIEASGLRNVGALGRLNQDSRDFAAARQAMVDHLAQQSHHIRAIDQVAADQAATLDKYRQAGLPVAFTDPATGKAASYLDHFVNQWIEAPAYPKSLTQLLADGTATQAEYNAALRQTGGKVQPALGMLSRRAIERHAADYGIDAADLQRVGSGYVAQFDQLGQKLVKLGRISPEAYAELRGAYLPRLYALYSQHKGDVASFLLEAEKQGLLTTEMEQSAANAASRRARAGMPAGGAGFTQSRVLPQPAPGNAAEAAGAGGSAASKAALGVRAQAADVGRHEAMRALANDARVTSSAKVKGWQAVPEEPRFGELAGKYVSPGTMRFLQDWDQARADVSNPLLRGLNKLSSAWKGIVTFEPTVQLGNILGHDQAGKMVARAAGTGYSFLGDVVPAYRDVLAIRRTGRPVDAASDYLLHHTNILSAANTNLAQVEKSIEPGFGLGVGDLPMTQPAGRQLVGRAVANGARAVPNAASRFYTDAQQATKLALFRKLTLAKAAGGAGMAPEQAAEAVQKALVDYTDTRLPGVPPSIVPPSVLRAGERYGLTPLSHFPLQAFPNYAKNALRAPDLLQWQSGNTARHFADQLADQQAAEEGRPPQAVAARLAGRTGILDVPIVKTHSPLERAIASVLGAQPADENGNQNYARIPWLAALERHFGAAEGAGDAVMRHVTPLAKPLFDLWANRALGTEIPIRRPGSAEAALPLQGQHLAESYVPQLRFLRDLWGSYQQQAPYSSATTPPQSWGQTVLSFLTGISTRPALGKTEQGRMSLVEERARDPEVAAKIRLAEAYADRRTNPLGLQGSLPPSVDFTGRVQQFKSVGAVKQELFDARRVLAQDLLGYQFRGPRAEGAIRQQVDYILALAQRAEDLAGPPTGGEQAGPPNPLAPAHGLPPFVPRF